jgi:hypothetical protein
MSTPATGRGSLLKVYLRDAAAAGFVAAYLRERLPAAAQFLVLGADICRRELLAEIDAADFSARPNPGSAAPAGSGSYG